ncbi:MAG: DUF4118 domain-containing protein, partial [Nostoc sp.]
MPHIHSSLLRYSIVVLIVAVALAIMLMLDPWLSMSASPFLLFFSAVMVSAWYGGLKSGLLATSLSALLSDYFFLPPVDELNFDISNCVPIGLFAFQGLLFSIICDALKTAKRQADENLQKLRVSEERFQLALSSSDIVVFQQDRDLRYQWIHHPQGLDTTEEILGKSDDQLFPALVTEQLRAIKLKALETGVATREEVYLTISGKDRYYDLLVKPLKDADNNIQGITCIGVNITERQQTEERLRYIAEFSSLLSTSLDYEQTLQQIAKISVPQLADWCSVDILNEDDSIRRLPIAHVDPAKAELAHKLEQYIPDRNGGNLIAKVLQTRQAELISEVSDSLFVGTTQNQKHLELIRELGIKSLMIVPLIAHQRLLGCISFATAESDHRYDRSDLTLATDISHRAALAVENARLYQDMQQALVHYGESLSLLDALLGAAPVAVCFLDRELRYIRINQVFADINGLTIEEHLGRKFGEVLPAMAAESEL